MGAILERQGALLGAENLKKLYKSGDRDTWREMTVKANKGKMNSLRQKMCFILQDKKQEEVVL